MVAWSFYFYSYITCSLYVIQNKILFSKFKKGNEEIKSSENRKSSTKHKDKSNNLVGSNVNVDIHIKGNKLEPCEKLEIPHRSLYNYIVSNNKVSQLKV